MTERLSTLLHQEADEIDVPQPPTGDLLVGGRRLRRRHRRAAVAGGCAAVLVLGGGAVVVNRQLDDTRVIDPEVAAAAYASDGAFAVGRDLYVGEEHFRWDEPIRAIYYTSAGVVVRSGETPNPGDGGRSSYELVTPTGERSEIHAAMSNRIAGFEPDSTHFAYATQDDGRLEVVVQDAVTDEEIARVTVLDRTGRVRLGAPPVSIDGDLVWVRTDDGWSAVDWRTGTVHPVPGTRHTYEIQNGRYAVQRGRVWNIRSTATEQSVGLVTLRKGWYAFFSPDGRFMRSFPNEEESTDDILAIVHDVATDESRELPGVESDIGWTPDGHLLLLDGDTVSICEAMADKLRGPELRPRLGHRQARRQPVRVLSSTRLGSSLWDHDLAMDAVLDARLRWVRALVAGSVAFLLGVTGHVMADGLLPGPTALTVLLAFSTLLAMPVLGRRISSVRTVALLVGGQTFIHLCLTMTSGHAGDVRGSSTAATPSGLSQLPTLGGRRVGSLQDAYLGTPSDAATPVVPGHLIGDLHAHAPMMAVHLAAAALVGLWLAYGERLLLSVATLTGQRLLALVHRVVPVAVPAVSMASYDAHLAPAGPRSAWLTLPDSRRGPPLLQSV